MLCELRVENLLLIERAELCLAPGLNVITGETGAGKTVLAHALDLLLGGRARPGIVRPGAAEAYVEGVFELPTGLRAELGLQDRVPADAQELVLARRVAAEGRTRAYLGGRSATVAELRDVGGALLAFYGQHEHRRLTLASAQLEVLDGFCGAAQVERRSSYAAARAARRAAAEELERLHERTAGRERELDLLEWELAEIEQADPSESEEAELRAGRERLRHHEALRAAAAGAVEALSPDDASGAAALAAAAAGALDGAAGVDPDLDALAGRVHALALEAEDAAADLRRYAEAVQEAPGRLEEVEERLAGFERLTRKHGGTVAAVLEHARACRARRDELTGAAEALPELQRALDQAEGELVRTGEQLRAARHTAAPALGQAVRERLGALAMEGAGFEAELAPQPEWGPTGGDAVEFMIAPNPGVPAAPLRETASGGELSRVMLALMSAAAQAGPATLVFDEVDAGIGGQTARAVGEQLRLLAGARQLLCITHLPQIASLADRHFRIAKDASAEPARTAVTQLEPGEVVGELVRMLGADDEDGAARRHARELLRAA